MWNLPTELNCKIRNNSLFFLTSITMSLKAILAVSIVVLVCCMSNIHSKATKQKDDKLVDRYLNKIKILLLKYLADVVIPIFASGVGAYLFKIYLLSKLTRLLGVARNENPEAPSVAVAVAVSCTSSWNRAMYGSGSG